MAPKQGNASQKQILQSRITLRHLNLAPHFLGFPSDLVRRTALTFTITLDWRMRRRNNRLLRANSWNVC